MSQALIPQALTLPVPGALGSLDAYLSACHAFPMLSAEEERALATRLRDHDDLDAARTLVLSHLRFVAHIARGYLGYGLALGDIIQEGNIGLMKAVKRYDPDLGVRLVSYAVHWIRAEIHEFVLRNWRIVKVATTKAQRKLFFNLRNFKRRLGWLNRAEVEAVAQELGVEPAEVVEMEARLSGHDLALDPHEDDDDSHTSPAHWLAAPTHSDPALALEAGDWERDQHMRLERGLGGLDARSREIVQRRWLDGDKATLQELADRHGISAERVRQIETNAIRKLQQALVS
jgi:RNA polymerase sigma-32 factor